MKYTHTIDILMSTYDGATYLEEQIDSIINQDYEGWSLLIRDDGSADSTVKIINDFALNNDRITIPGTDRKNIGPASSFMQLLTHSTSDYFMFADQDDVWKPDKIKKTLAAMQEAEKQYGSNTPLLVHTNLRVVDEKLQPIAPSFWKYQNLNPQLGSNLNRVMPQNVVTGCTVMINRALAELAIPIPEDAIMHDWWLALVAAAFGKVICLDQATMLYRQHGSNSVGAKRWGAQRIFQQLRNAAAVRESMLKTMRQAEALLNRYRERMSPEQIVMVEAYAALPAMTKATRIKSLLKYRFFKHGLFRTIGFMANLLMIERATP